MMATLGEALEHGWILEGWSREQGAKGKGLRA
jgi:hypothetical protein